MYADSVAVSMPRVDLIASQRTFLARVFQWMGVGLLLTGLVAWAVGRQPDLAVSLMRGGLIWVLFLVELGLVIGISRAVTKFAPAVAATLFVIYSLVNGVTLAPIFLVYTQTSIATTFFVSAATFGVAAAYGYATKKDLSSFGSLCFMGLIGIVIASVLNFFLHSSALGWAISFIGLFVFIGLAAYDMQKLKAIHRHGVEGGAQDRALAIGGSLALYLDFINLFLILLQLFGRQRD